MLVGLFLGAGTFFGFYLIFKKLPKPIQARLRKHKLFTDIVTSFLAWMMLSSVSKSIIALIGTMVAGLMAGMALEIFKDDK